MNIFLEEHQNVIKEMLEEGIEFILIGGYAVNYHGYNRTTGDLDVWLKPDNENKSKLLAYLQKNEIDDDSLELISTLDFTQATVFSIDEIPYKIDFLTKVSGVSYDDADREKIIFEEEGIAMPFISLNHLVLTKMGTGRGKDKIDIEMLQEVKKAKEKQ